MAHTDYTDPVQVRRAYKFRAYPTRPQEGRAARLLADHCDLYNAALEERREAWKMRHISVSYSAQPARADRLLPRPLPRDLEREPWPDVDPETPDVAPEAGSAEPDHAEGCDGADGADAASPQVSQ